METYQLFTATNSHPIFDMGMIKKDDLVTPYQGKKRCFGEYKCNRCAKEWKSSNSKANEPQNCTNCNSKVFPFKQKSLQGIYEDLRNKKEMKLLAIQEALNAQKRNNASNNNSKLMTFQMS